MVLFVLVKCWRKVLGRCKTRIGAIGAVAGHEIVHTTDKEEINKDLQSTQGNPRKDDRETKPKQVERKIIKQSKKLKQ